MTDFSNVTIGDRVRVTYEFIVDDVGRDWFYYADGNTYWNQNLVSVEVVKPPFVFPTAANSIIEGIEVSYVKTDNPGEWRSVWSGTVCHQSEFNTNLDWKVLFDAGANNG